MISEDGLIATCAHVIGESRGITVRFDDGEEREVTAVHAWDRTLDLAVLRVEAEGLRPLELAGSEDIEQGMDQVRQTLDATAGTD